MQVLFSLVLNRGGDTFTSFLLSFTATVAALQSLESEVEGSIHGIQLRKQFFAPMGLLLPPSFYGKWQIVSHM